MKPLMTRDEAMERFRRLVARYGLQWRADVPREAHVELAEVNKVLTEEDRREAVMALWTPFGRNLRGGS